MSTKSLRQGVSRDLRIAVRTRNSAREQAVLLGPAQRQIEFGQTRRGELDGLPPLQDRFDQLRAQEGKVNQAPDVAAGDAIDDRPAPGAIGRGRSRVPQTRRARARSP